VTGILQRVGEGKAIHEITSQGSKTFRESGVVLKGNSKESGKKWQE
jgi:hypothetical protein